MISLYFHVPDLSFNEFSMLWESGCEIERGNDGRFYIKVVEVENG